MSYLKCCMVPLCTNTSIKTPNKIFISVPRNKNRRKWLRAARRDDKEISLQTRFYCCEDHFDLPNDMENYIEYSMTKCRIRMKKEVIPHKFDCQPDRKRASTSSMVREFSVKRQRQSLIQELISSESASISTETSTVTEIEMTASENIQTNETQQSLDEVKPIMRNKYIQCTANLKNVTTFTSPLKKILTDTTTSPLKIVPTAKKQPCARTLKFEISSGDESSILSRTNTSSSASYVAESSSQKSDYSSDLEEENLQLLSIRRSSLLIKKNPRFYLGLPKPCYFLLNVISEEARIPIINIYLCLKKIRLNTTLLELSHDFGMSVSKASRIFKTCVPLIASHLKPFIAWQNNRKKIVKNLPRAFRFRYYKVCTIIDCLEIQIEKPSNPVKQSLSWSDYKKANTLKYLISCTPDGIINFISRGYSGRITDALLVEECGYLDHLHEGTEVMADREFKHIEHLLITKKCKLIRPPSVFSSAKPTKQQVLESKKIASLRIHVERVITRVREFKFLAPHACIDNHLIPYTDHIIIIVAALINLQGPLIKSK